MRPVRTPDNPIGIGRNQRLRQRRHIRKIRRPLGDAIGAGDLHIYTAGFHQVEQRDEIRLARTLSRIAAAEMVDHHRERHLPEVILQPRDDGRASVDLHMPAQPADLLDGRVEDGFGIGRIEPSRRVGFEIKPHAANARGCHLLQRRSRCGPVDDRNAARAPPHAAHSVKRAGVVGAVDARLHHHDAIEVKVALELEQLLDGSLRRRVDALFCKWKLVLVGSPNTWTWQSQAPRGTSKSTAVRLAAPTATPACITQAALAAALT